MELNEDLKLKLLAGLPIEIDNNITIYPLTIKEITKLGYSKYNYLLSKLLIEKNDIVNYEQINLQDVSNYDLLILFCYYDHNFRRECLDALNLFTKQTFYYSEKGFFYLKDKTIISENKFNKIIKIIKYINNIDIENDDFNPSNEKAKEIIEKMKKTRKIINKCKGNEGEPLTFYDLVSILAANGNEINIINVWDLTLYAFNNQFNRMKMLEDYYINIRSLLAGADPKKIELKHWMSKIN